MKMIRKIFQHKIWRGIFLAASIILWPSSDAMSVRIKDMAQIVGVRGNQLIGYGLVIGLKGTGDSTNTEFTIQSLVNMLQRMGVSVDKKDVKVKNVAAVVVTAELPPFARAGTRLDALVSSMGDAKSLQGGTLLLTPLKAPDGKVYAVAQGPLSTGGFAFGGAAGGGVQVNHPTVGRIVSGILIEKEIPNHFNEKNDFTLALHNPDFSTVYRCAEAINRELNEQVATALDAGTLSVKLPAAFHGKLPELIARIQALDVPVDTPARVIINERTGTVVMGENVRLSKIAISHGNLSIIVKEQFQVSQPNAFAPPPGEGVGTGKESGGPMVAPGGQTVVTPESDVTVKEDKAHLMVLQENVNIGDLVRALNALGVSPRDLITILQTIKAAGALHAELQII